MELNKVLTDIKGRPIDIKDDTVAIVAASVITKQPCSKSFRVVVVVRKRGVRHHPLLLYYLLLVDVGYDELPLCYTSL